MELTLPFTRPLPDLEAIGEWLADKRPEDRETTLVHGDYKLDNVVFADGPPPRLIAILDWEMSTLGDPLADLGWMVSFWREAGEEDDDVFTRTSRVTALPGFQSRDDLVERYASRTGRDVSNLTWYQVLAVWKLAILLEGSYARHLAGMTDDPFFAEMEHGVPALAARALEVTRG
jgi:aminoglycoside phosphotransferase (APT) family kinase protein